jgi:hypothetical protein
MAAGTGEYTGAYGDLSGPGGSIAGIVQQAVDEAARIYLPSMQPAPEAAAAAAQASAEQASDGADADGEGDGPDEVPGSPWSGSRTSSRLLIRVMKAAKEATLAKKRRLTPAEVEQLVQQQVDDELRQIGLEMDAPDCPAADKAMLKKHRTAIEKLADTKSKGASWNQLFWSWVEKFKKHGCVSPCTHSSACPCTAHDCYRSGLSFRTLAAACPQLRCAPGCRRSSRAV